MSGCHGQSLTARLLQDQRNSASAKLHLPLGVVRILVGDMADEQLVMVHRPTHGGDRPDLALLERVLYGLHTI